jgi:catechol 2,3-dioxygenase-like lactoylglutathione lyase family enzyme
MSRTHSLTAIVPCNDLDVSEAFYARLGFKRTNHDDEGYVILTDGHGGDLHLTATVEGWLVPGRNPFGLYLYSETVDELAAPLGDILIHKPENKPWGMYEFAISDPDGTLVRVGCPSRLRSAAHRSPLENPPA